MVQRLMHAAYILRVQTRRHRFHALAFTRQQQSSAVVLQRHSAIRMPTPADTFSRYAENRFCCALGGVEALTKQFYLKLFVYNTVVLVDMHLVAPVPLP
jgi:hypothetical protein